ncbi:alpha/beta hydrolase [Phenylobacterium sp.]|uniref:alpha/beta fold hydrolase n=1 Tax=Phenylobacterium sp. TaxID=1871053 RepID=UPI001211AAED|nr:alpha/beta hydrolase [Phenylobacterium sp.]THD61382.1 MAG: alpha/beta hydrolase [Phenylobacterium sp.]
MIESPFGKSGECHEVDGRRLAMQRLGAGGPAVVFAPGAGLVGGDYLNIHRAIAAHTTSVVYDRAGTGWSGDCALPRSAREVAEELRGLLRAARVDGPYILVGHSLGGAYVRRFAQLFPGEVAGLLFLDPSHEAYLDFPAPTLTEQLRMAPGLIRAAVNMRGFYRPMFERMFAGFPEGERRGLVDYHLMAWRRTLQETKTLYGEVLPEIRGGGDLPDVPTILLAAMGLDPFMTAFSSEAYLRDVNTRKWPAYLAFAASTPQGEARALPDAGHSTIHTDRPDAVIQALRDLLAHARRPAAAPTLVLDRAPAMALR